MSEPEHRFRRVPIGFGPSPGPRFDRDGHPFSWDATTLTITDLVVDVDRHALQSILPDGYEVEAGVQATALFQTINLDNVPWLAGRGYNTWGVYANNVICRRTPENVKGSYLLVLLENAADPIITGREELGFPKVYCELPDPIREGGKLVHTASWGGTEFLRLEVADLKDTAPPTSIPARTYTMPALDGLLSHRSIPSVGEPGKYDASYATYMPGDRTQSPKILSFATTGAPLNETRLTITTHPFENLPTLWHIVDGLAALNPGEVREVDHLVMKGGSDYHNLRRLE